jgi:hypothetical protein
MQPSNQYIVQLHALQRHVGLLVTEREILEGRRRQLSDMVTALTRQVSRYIVRVAELELDLSAYRQHPRTGLGMFFVFLILIPFTLSPLIPLSFLKYIIFI